MGRCSSVVEGEMPLNGGASLCLLLLSQRSCMRCDKPEEQQTHRSKVPEFGRDARNDDIRQRT